MRLYSKQIVRLCILLPVLFCMVGITAVAQVQDYRTFRNISLGVSTAANCFVQDSEGMIWVGSEKGLYTYDGFSIYPHYELGKLSNTHIYCAIRVGDSRFYLGSDNGLLIYNYRTECYENNPSIAPRDIRCMVLDGDNVWLGSINGLYLYSITSGRCVRFRAGGGLPHNTIYSLIKASDGRVYIGTYNGFCYYDAKKRTFLRIVLPDIGRKNNLFINSLLEDRLRHCIWIGTEGDLYRYDLSTGQVSCIRMYHGNSVKTLTLDSRNRLLVGTDDGLHVFDSRVDKYIYHDSRNASSLSGDIVWGLFTDAQGNVWIGTDGGISIASSIVAERFIPISQITGLGNGNQFYTIYRDSKARLWLGGSNGLIQSDAHLGAGASSKWYRVGSYVFPLRHNHIRSIYQDRDKKLWIATDGGIMQLDESSGQWRHYNLVDRSHSFNANWAYDLFEDAKGRLWVATCMGGILVVDKHKLERSSSICEADFSLNRSNGLAGMYIGQIAPDRAGNVWALLYNNSIGVQKIDMKTMKVATLSALHSYHIGQNSRLLVDGEGHIWIAYPGGVFQFSSAGRQLRRISFGDNYECQILSMTEVKNKIWISSTDGIWIVDKKSGRVEQRGSDSIDFTCLWYNVVDNLIYMGYRDGIAVSSPESFCRDGAGHRLQLTAIYVNNTLMPVQQSQSVRYLSSLEFSHNENHIVFCFSDLPYSLTEKNKYAFKLDGEDKDWNTLPPGTNQIAFNNLKPGSYHLIVKCVGTLNGGGGVLDIPFVILPPWYLTWWAKTFYLLIIVGFLLWIVNFYRIRNKLHIERIEKRQIAEQARLKMDFFANVSHDFKTPLSMIIAPISRLLLEVKNDGVKKQLETVERNAMKLNSMTQQILDFDRIENQSNAMLMLSKVDYVSFVRKIFDGFVQDSFKEKDQKGIFSSDRDAFYLEIDMLKMESAIANVLSNASKYSPRGRTIEMKVVVGEESLQVVVSDNGIGIPQKDLPYVSQRFFQSSKTVGEKLGTGIGLYLSRAYTELHGGSFQISSVEGKGTTVTITLPSKKPDTNFPFVPSSGTPQLTVLIVEDEEEMGAFIVDVLSESFHCEWARNGKIGLEKAQILLPDLIVTDVMMPEMDGLEMCRQIRKYIPTSVIPVIMLTGKSDRQTELDSIRMNIDIFLPKPFDANVLLLRARQLVGNHERKEVKERIEQLSVPQEIQAISGDEKFLQEITRMIEDRISDYDLNVNSLCEQYGIASKQLYRKLKQLTGQTPVEYIKSIRMKKAAMLLEQHKFTIAEVMYMVGFSNSSYFSKCFQAAFGKTPRQYVE